MKCSQCGGQMNIGAPHCETIKIQYECRCGNIECVYYTTEETKVNELTAATGASLPDCRAALESVGYDLDKAEANLNLRHRRKTLPPTLPTREQSSSF